MVLQSHKLAILRQAATSDTSGNSPSILRALETAKDQKLLTVGWLGRDGGQAKELCDLSLIVPSQSTARIQEGHELLYHVLCEWIDQRVD